MFLDPDDDLSTVRSKLEASSAEEIYLVLPRRAVVLRTPLEFRILARIANELASETILITGDQARRRLAEHEGFRTKRSLQSMRHLMVAPGQRPPRLMIPDWVPIPGAAGLLTAVALLVLAGLVFGVVLPEMRVTLIPQTTQVSRDIDVTVDPGSRTADTATGTLPGEVLNQRLEVAGSLPIPADRTVGQDRARGEVLITSRRPQPSQLSRGSTARVPDGPLFTIDQDVQLQPNVPARVGVTAAEPGSGGNVGPGTITRIEGPAGQDLQVQNQRATTGGADRQAAVVTEEDQKALKDQLSTQARDRAFFELRGRAGPDRSLPEQGFSMREESVVFDQQAGAQSAQLTGRMAVTASATAFQNLAFNELVSNILTQTAGSDATLSGSPRIQPPAVLGVQGQQVKLRTRASGVVLRSFDLAQVRETLRWKSTQEAQVILARLSGLAQPPRIEISPSWAPRAYRVAIDVQGPK